MESSSCCHLIILCWFVFRKPISQFLAEVGRKGVDFEERCSYGSWHGPCLYNSNRLRWCVFENWLHHTSPPSGLYLLPPTAQTIQYIQSSLVPFLVLKPFHHIMSNHVTSCHSGPKGLSSSYWPPLLRTGAASSFLLSPHTSGDLGSTDVDGRGMLEWMVECYCKKAMLGTR